MASDQLTEEKLWQRRIDKWCSEYQKECEKNHEKARSYYNNKFPPTLTSVNLIFSFGRAMVPQLYFKNPSVSVKIKGPQEGNSKFLEEADITLLKQMMVKRTIKKMIVNAYLTGRGVAKCGFADQTERPVFDPDSLEKPNQPWFLSILTKNWATEIPPDGDVDDITWAAMRVARTRDQLEALPDFNGREMDDHLKALPEDDPDATIELWEVWDRSTGMTGLLHKDVWATKQKDFTLWPFKVLEFNWVPEETLPVSDAELILQMQEEYNETNTQLSEHRRIALLKIIARTNALKQGEREKLEQGKVGALLEIDAAVGQSMSDSIETLTPEIPEGLFVAKQGIMQDVKDVIGFSRNQLGEMQSGSQHRTFGEAAIVQQALQIRLDERRDMGADLIESVMRTTNQICFQFWEAEDAAKYAGVLDPGIWNQLKTLTQDDYLVNIVPDSTLPLSKMVQKQNSQQLYSLLKGDPLIDQVELRKMLLESYEGVNPNKLLDPMGIQAYQMMHQMDPLGGPQLIQGTQGVMGSSGQRTGAPANKALPPRRNR